MLEIPSIFLNRGFMIFPSQYKFTYNQKIVFENYFNDLNIVCPKIFAPLLTNGGKIFSNFIGSYCFFNENSYIRTQSIGHFCSIGPNVKIGLPEHDYNLVSTHMLFGVSPPVFSNFSNFDSRVLTLLRNNSIRTNSLRNLNLPIIGNDVWIGANVIIGRNVIVGDGAVIGAGSVVTKNVPPYTVVGGVPAKILKQRFSNHQINKLLKFKWWNYHPSILIDIDLEKIDQCIDIIIKRINSGKYINNNLIQISVSYRNIYCQQ